MEIKWNDAKLLKEFKAKKQVLEKNIANAVVDRAKARCPVGEYSWSKTSSRSGGYTQRVGGALRDSIGMRASKYKDGGYLVYAGGRDTYYASFVELGTSRQKGKGFMRGAAHAEKRAFANEVRKLCKQVFE